MMNNLESHDRKNSNLLGKAVLLIGNDPAVLKNLVAQLAQKGADIVLLCWQLPLETARWLKEKVQGLGQRLLLIEQVNNQTSSFDQLIDKITREWGHFDIFIDISAKKSERTPSLKEAKQSAGWQLSQWHLTQVVLEEMARE